MRRMAAVLMCLLLLPALAAGESFVFGSSEMGRALVCHRLGAEDAEFSFLLTFAVHGFEGAADHDGQYLVDIAQRLIDHYAQQPESLENFALYIVPCVNPDGLIDGVGESKIGRLNAKGLDINRDFPVKWRKHTKAMYRTGEEPFTTAEARAVRDLVKSIRPTYAADIHGWINGVYGDDALCKAFWQAFGFPIREYSGGGMMSQWYETQTKAAVLVELPHRPGREGYVDDNSAKLIEALDVWMEQCRAM